jgi:hypothetical protein
MLNKARIYKLVPSSILKLRKLYGSETFLKYLSIFSWVALLCSACFVAFMGSRADITNADQFVSTYAISDINGLRQLALASDHTNFLKVPILYLQGKLDYNFVSYVGLNIMLVGGTFVGWSLVLRKFISSRSVVCFNLLMSGILLSSPLLAINLSMSTIRNIEFPIAFLAAYLIFKTWSAPTVSNIRKSGSAAVALIALLVLSDSFFLYVFAPALIVSFLASMKWSEDSLDKVAINCGLVVTGVAAGLLAKIVLVKAGFIVIANSAPKSFVSFEDIPRFVYEVLREVYLLIGGDVFGLQVGYKIIGVLLYFIFATFLVFILLRNTKKTARLFKFKLDFLKTLLVSLSILTLVAYAFSSNVVMDGANIRYISFIAILLPTMFVLEYSDNLKRVKMLTLVSCLLFLSALPNTVRSYRLYYSRISVLEADRQKQINEISSALDEQNVQVALSTFTYSTTSMFASNGEIRVYPISSCNISVKAVANARWYSPEDAITKSAIIVDPNPRGPETWVGCDLERLYGKESSKKVVSTRNGKEIVAYIYSYDVRSRLDVR